MALVFCIGVAQFFWPREAQEATATAAPKTATTDTSSPKVEPPRLGDKSIAVLPFANMSDDKEDAYFADGLTEEVLNALAQVREAKVISRTSSSAFVGKTTPLPEIAKVLGVRYILEGSVRRNGDQARVTAQLIDVQSDTHLWSKSFEPKIDHVFAVQDDIARAIALALNSEFAAAANPREAPTRNLEAYRLWLKQNELGRLAPAGVVAELAEINKRVVAEDPDFAEAHASLATNYATMGVIDPSATKTAFPLAKKAAEAAARLKPHSASALNAACVIAFYELRWGDAIDSCSRSRKLSTPTAMFSRLTIASPLWRVGKFNEAKQMLKEGQDLDPLNRNYATQTLFMSIDNGDDRTIRAITDRIAGSTQEIGVMAHYFLALISMEQGERETAAQEFEAFMRSYGKFQDLTKPVADALRSEKRLEAAVRAVHAVAEKDPTFEPLDILRLLDMNGAWIDEMSERLAAGDTVAVAWRIGGVWRLVAKGEGGNPKVKQLMRNAGLVDYWKKHGWPDRCRPKGEDDFECS